MLSYDSGLSQGALRKPAPELALHCCICGAPVTDSTLLLECLHCCCASCADSAVATDDASRPINVSIGGRSAAVGRSRLVTCPHCQEPTRVSSALGVATAAALEVAQLASVRPSPAVGHPQCSFCLEDGILRRSEHWCSDCVSHMCRSCLVTHNKFHRQHVAVAVPSDADTASSIPGAMRDAAAASLAARLCVRHLPGSELFCFACGAVRCVACPEGSACLSSGHELLSVHDPRAVERIACLLDDARLAEAALLSEQAASLPFLLWVASADSADSRVLAALDSAKQRDEALLQANKARLLQVVDAAYARATRALDNCYGSLTLEVRTSAGSARLLKSKLEHSVTFGRAVLDAASASAVAKAGSASNGSLPHGSGLLTHLRCLSQRLRAVAAECHTAVAATSSSALLREPTAAAADGCFSSPVVALNSHWPKELDNVVSMCIGMPQIASPIGLQVNGGLSSADGYRQQPAADVKLAAESYDSLVSCYSSGSQSSTPATIDEATPNADDSSRALPPSLCFDSNCKPSSFRAEFKCWDMAVVGRGTVMVAAYGDGLREYSADGRELSFWLPPSFPKQGRSTGSRIGDIAADGNGIDSVYSVDVTSDDRAVVALLRSRAIVVLCRDGTAQSPADSLSAGRATSGGGGGWSEDLRIALPFHPWRLASHGNQCVAVAYARCERRKFLPGPSFELFSLSDGESLLRRTLQYNVVAVAVTSGSVVVASERQQLPSDPHSRWTLVDAYSREGSLLWRHECNDSIFDIASEPEAGQRVYLALSDSRRVIAITGDESGGSLPDDDVAVASIGEAPVRLSLCRAGRHSALAVLLFDLRSICIYS